MSLRISVVIPTYRRPDLLERCLQAVTSQSLDPSAYEVIVVDDGHTRDTRDVVARFARECQGRPEVRYLRSQGTRGPAGARNRGWEAARGELIAFTDDDTIPQPDWLAQGERAVTAALVAVYGRVIVPTPHRPTDNELNTKGLETAEFVTANAFVRRSALKAVAGFDERFTRAWREDSDLYFKLLRQGGAVSWAPLATVLHPVRPAPWGVCLSQQRNVFFDALLYKKHRRLYRLKIRWLPPLRYYFIVSCALVALLGLLAGLPRLATLAGGLSLAGCLHFAWLRLQRTSWSPVHVAEMLVTSIAIPFLAIFWRLAGAWRFRVLFL